MHDSLMKHTYIRYSKISLFLSDFSLPCFYKDFSLVKAKLKFDENMIKYVIFENNFYSNKSKTLKQDPNYEYIVFYKAKKNDL